MGKRLQINEVFIDESNIITDEMINANIYPRIKFKNGTELKIISTDTKNSGKGSSNWFTDISNTHCGDALDYLGILKDQNPQYLMNQIRGNFKETNK